MTPCRDEKTSEHGGTLPSLEEDGSSTTPVSNNSSPSPTDTENSSRFSLVGLVLVLSILASLLILVYSLIGWYLLPALYNQDVHVSLTYQIVRRKFFHFATQVDHKSCTHFLQVIVHTAHTG